MKATEAPCVERRRAHAIAIACRVEPQAAPAPIEVWHEVQTRADEEANVRCAHAQRLAVLRRRLGVLRRRVERSGGWSCEAVC